MWRRFPPPPAGCVLVPISLAVFANSKSKVQILECSPAFYRWSIPRTYVAIIRYGDHRLAPESPASNTWIVVKGRHSQPCGMHLGPPHSSAGSSSIALTSHQVMCVILCFLSTAHIPTFIFCPLADDQASLGSVCRCKSAPLSCLPGSSYPVRCIEKRSPLPFTRMSTLGFSHHWDLNPRAIVGPSW